MISTPPFGMYVGIFVDSGRQVSESDVHRWPIYQLELHILPFPMTLLQHADFNERFRPITKRAPEICCCTCITLKTVNSRIQYKSSEVRSEGQLEEHTLSGVLFVVWVCVCVCLYMKSSNQVFFIIIFPWYSTLVHSKLIWIWIHLKWLLCLSGQVWAQYLSGCFLVSPRLFQLCESLEDLLNVNGELRSEGQAIWTLLGGILGQVRLPLLSVHTSPSS